VIVVVCGVAGVGKTTVGQVLAEELGWDFHDADDFHPTGNVDKMSRGIPLTDKDREPWLERLRQLIEHCINAGMNAVFACSALKKAYRDRLQVRTLNSFFCGEVGRELPRNYRNDGGILSPQRFLTVSLTIWKNPARQSPC